VEGDFIMMKEQVPWFVKAVEGTHQAKLFD
jgi:hypothetical protein